MFKKIPVFALAFVSGSALAGPVGALLGNLTGSAPAPVALPGLGSLPTQQLGRLTSGLANTLTSTAPLPGLGGGAQPEGVLPLGNALPIEATVLNDGQNSNAGYDEVVRLGQQNGGEVITSGNETGDNSNGGDDDFSLTDLNNDPLLSGVPLADSLTGALGLEGTGNEALGTPYLLSSDGDAEAIDVGIFDGNGTANASQDMGLGAAIGSGSDTGNGTIGIGIGNETGTGNGSAIGIAALSDNRDGNSGNGGQLGISLLNQGDALTISGMGMSGGTDTLGDSPLGGGTISTDGTGLDALVGLTILGGDGTANNGMLANVAVLSGNNSGNGGLIAAGILSGDNVGQSESGIGAGLISGDNAGSGAIAAGVLTGDNSATTVGGVLAAAVLSGNNSGNGFSGQTADAPLIGAAVLSGGNSANDAGAITNAGVLTKAGTAPPPAPGGTGPIGGNPEEVAGGTVIGENSAADAGNRNALCSILTKDGRGKVIAKTKVRCGALRSPNV